jgi:hypothetical protein
MAMKKQQQTFLMLGSDTASAAKIKKKKNENAPRRCDGHGWETLTRRFDGQPKQGNFGRKKPLKETLHSLILGRE